MTLEGIIIGLLAAAVGAAFCFSGLRFFLILLPIWGFLAGFVFGSNGIFYLFGNEHTFFATSLAIVVGLVVGIAFALFSYLYYYVAVILLGASLGYFLGIGIMDWLNIDGILAWIVGIALGAVFAYGFMISHMPAIVAIVGTAVGGASAIVAGVLLFFGRVPVGSLNGGSIGSMLADTQYPWLWILIGIGLAVGGVVAQLRGIAGVAREITGDMYRNPGMAA